MVHELTERLYAEKYKEEINSEKKDAYTVSHNFAIGLEGWFYGFEVTVVKTQGSNESDGVKGSFTGQVFINMKQKQDDGTYKEWGVILQYNKGDVHSVYYFDEPHLKGESIEGSKDTDTKTDK